MQCSDYNNQLIYNKVEENIKAQNNYNKGIKFFEERLQSISKDGHYF